MANQGQGHFAEFALNQAAQELDCPLLARPLYLYRASNELNNEKLAAWLGLNEVEELHRLAMCLTPRPGGLSPHWDEAFAELASKFPTLRCVRLQLVIAATCPTRKIGVSF
jgi:hypothetical protein